MVQQAWGGAFLTCSPGATNTTENQAHIDSKALDYSWSFPVAYENAAQGKCNKNHHLCVFKVFLKQAYMV